MPKYAQHGPAATAPALGWFDTICFPAISLPPLANLITLTEAEWEAHFAGNWAVSEGGLVPHVLPAPVADPAAPSMAELQAELSTLRAQVGQLHIN